MSTASLFKYLKNPFYIPILTAQENNVSPQDPNMAEIQDGSMSVRKDLTAFALKNENINLYLEVYISYCCTHKSRHYVIVNAKYSMSFYCQRKSY